MSREADNAVRLADGRLMRPALVAGVLAAHPPAFVAGASRIFAPCGTLALGFSARTGRRVGALGPHQGRVTAACAGPSRDDCAAPVATGTSHGEVKLWDGKGCTCLASLELGGPVLSLRWPRPNLLVVIVGGFGAASRAERIDVPSLEAARHAGSLPLSAECTGAFDAAGSGYALADGKTLLVWAEGWQRCLRLQHGNEITAVAVDPLGRYVAAGDDRGVVWTWWGVLDGDARNQMADLVPARWQWHSEAVRALIACGPLLLSGGNEGVLAIRAMEDDSVQFVPRFPAAINHIAVACGGSHVCVSLEDNSLGVIDDLTGWVKPRWIHGVDVVAHRAGAHRAERKLRSHAVLHGLPGGEGVALTSGGRRVQFLDADGKPVPGRPMPLMRNTGANLDPMICWALRQVAFGLHAACILTVEDRVSPALQRFDAAAAFSCVLKWWRRSEDGSYVLDSIVNNPHNDEVTLALANPLRDTVFATASLDGSFKVWDRLPMSSGAGEIKRQCWQCLLSGSWRCQKFLCGCFGADGSALALGVRGFVALWELEDGTELQSLPLGEVDDEPLQLCSVLASERFMLLASTRGQGGREEIRCWDLVTLEVMARLDLTQAIPGTAPFRMRLAAPPVLRLLGFRDGEAEIRSWALSSDGTFEEEASASLTKTHGVVDVLPVGNSYKCRILCWTSKCELWEIDLTQDAGAPEQLTTAIEANEDAVAVQGQLGKLLAGRTTTSLPGQSRRLLNLPLRTTAAQQAGLVPRIVQKMLPPHLPSHMLPPPGILFSNFLALYGKPIDGAGFAEDDVGPNGFPAEQEDFASTVAESFAGAASRQSSAAELVDRAWMDELVKGLALPCKA